MSGKKTEVKIMKELLTFEEWCKVNKHMKKNVKVTVVDDVELDMCSVSEVIDMLSQVVKTNPNAEFNYEYYGYDGSFSINIIDIIEESDEEFNDRLFDNYDSYVTKYNKDLKQYEKLKKQFEGDV